MACPYFIPVRIHPRELWPRRYSLPLGDGFLGGCALLAGEACGEEMLRTRCNLGYAECPRLPASRECDAVRFLCRREDGGRVRVAMCAEQAHMPVLTREWIYDPRGKKWQAAPEERFRALGEAAVLAFLADR